METAWAELCYAELEVPLSTVEDVAQMGAYIVWEACWQIADSTEE